VDLRGRRGVAELSLGAGGGKRDDSERCRRQKKAESGVREALHSILDVVLAFIVTGCGSECGIFYR
jgi:hypothetical protein